MSPDRDRRGLHVAIVAIFAAAVVLVAPSTSNVWFAGAASPPSVPMVSTAYAQSTDFATAIRQVVQQVRPAIVQITNLQAGPYGQTGGQAVPAGVGSGVIYDAQGHILTNNHVVAGQQGLVVSLPDKRSFNARLIGTDSQTDLAVIQIQGDNLPVAALGDSSELQLGDWVVAIGNALALPGGPTVTEGVVSAMGRTVQEPGDTANTNGPFLFNAVQTNAAINPGNSGGALANLQGQVIGINTLVAGQAEPGIQAQGIGFAIAINTAKPIADQLVARGQVVHPYLGIQFGVLTPAAAQQLGVRSQNGIIVGGVVPGSPAAQAGLQRGDVIVAVDDQPITDESSLPQILSTHQPGDTVSLTVQRGAQQFTVNVTLGQAPAS